MIHLTTQKNLGEYNESEKSILRHLTVKKEERMQINEFGI